METSNLINRHGDMALKLLNKIDVQKYNECEIDYFLKLNGEFGVEVVSQTFFKNLVTVHEWLNNENDGCVYPGVYKDEEDFMKHMKDRRESSIQSLFEDGPLWAVKIGNKIKVLKEPSEAYILD